MTWISVQAGLELEILLPQLFKSSFEEWISKSDIQILFHKRSKIKDEHTSFSILYFIVLL
jgi:hypothetical protein